MIQDFFLQHSYLIGLISFALGLVGMPIVIRIAKAKGLVVRPNKRMSHEGEVPNIGGLNICFSFVLTYHERVDSPANYRLIESVVDDENVKGNSLAAQGKCAGAYMEFREDENTPEQLMLNGGLVFRQHLAPSPPAEDMLNILEFDPELLAEAFTGGE